MVSNDLNQSAHRSEKRWIDETLCEYENYIDACDAARNELAT